MASLSLYVLACPYKDWRRMGRPKRAVFEYNYEIDTLTRDFYMLVYHPDTRVLWIRRSSSWGDSLLDVYILLNVNEVENELNIKHVACYENNHSLRYHLRTTNLDVIQLLKHTGVLELVLTKFFMENWTALTLTPL